MREREPRRIGDKGRVKPRARPHPFNVRKRFSIRIWESEVREHVLSQPLLP